jgi:aminoglycoside 6-adenylyltransferase
MRSEAEMLELILDFARSHDDIRAVIMNGSRVNPNAKKDPFQDYDIVYLVRDVEPYRRNPQVSHAFGELMILQLPDDMADPPPEETAEPPEGYGYLMQFMDGNRIDLGFNPLEHAASCVEDSLSVVLLDKDNRYGLLPPPSDRSHLTPRPTAKAFDDCCNEFWWVSPYVAKGLWRAELTYAHYMLDVYVRDQLLKMLAWYAGIQTGFEKSPGKLGKYLRGQVGEELWALLERTYADADFEHTWQALFTMGELFRRVARGIADTFGFSYPEQDDRRVSAYLRDIHRLPRDAREIYPAPG